MILQHVDSIEWYQVKFSAFLNKKLYALQINSGFLRQTMVFFYLWKNRKKIKLISKNHFFTKIGMLIVILKIQPTNIDSVSNRQYN